MSKFTSGTRVSAAVLALAFASGCGSENSVVGGRCAAGMEMSGGSCVADAPEVTLITPADPPSRQFAGTTATPPKKGETPVTTTLPLANPDPISQPPTDDPVEELAPEETVPVALPPSPPLPPPPPPPLVCDAPQIECRGACISVQSDPTNCGACNKMCPSNICVAGECQGATPGDVVLIGHDYQVASGPTAQSKVLVNALSIPSSDPIRVLSYEDGADANTVADTNALAAYCMLSGRKLRITRADGAGALASDSLARSYDVVLIHGVSSGDPAVLGLSWSASLGGFAAKGGVVVALDDGSSPMPQLMSSSGLITVASHTKLPVGTRLSVSAAQDVIGAQVPSPYAAFGMPVSFQGIPAASDDLTWVVRAQDASGLRTDPVIVHRIVR